ncbi:MAG: hypothetical protein ACRDRL_07240, partial [Sciscionella sp.]
RDPVRRKRLAIAVGVLSVATVALVVWIVTGVIGFFGNNGTPTGGPKLNAAATSSAPANPTTSAVPTTSAPAPVPVTPTSVGVFNVTGDPDSPRTVGNVLDGNPATLWRTQGYRQNFPALKPGVGIVADLGKPVALRTVAIDSPSAGTKVEIRTADQANASLDSTTVVGTKTLAAGHTEITVSKSPAKQYVIIWITSLGSDPSGSAFPFQSSIGAVSFTGTKSG